MTSSIFSFVQFGCCNYFGVAITTLNRNVLYFHLAKNGLYLIKWTINGFSDGLNSLTIVISGAAVLWDEESLERRPEEWLRRRL